LPHNFEVYLAMATISEKFKAGATLTSDDVVELNRAIYI
jgi:hypothetical protein